MSGSNLFPTIEQLPVQNFKVLRAIKKEGEAHMRYFEQTMSAFKFPERRVKTFDTLYYESVLPVINEILQQHKKT